MLYSLDEKPQLRKVAYAQYLDLELEGKKGYTGHQHGSDNWGLGAHRLKKSDFEGSRPQHEEIPTCIKSGKGTSISDIVFISDIIIQRGKRMIPTFGSITEAWSRWSIQFRKSEN